MSDLFEHFMELGLEAHMFASQWFLTLFTAKFPLFMVFHILDVFLSEVCLLDSDVWKLSARFCSTGPNRISGRAGRPYGVMYVSSWPGGGSASKGVLAFT